MIDIDDTKTTVTKDKKLRIPVYAHLVRHDTLGDFVIDPGLDRGYVKRKAGSIRGLAAPLFPIPGFQIEGTDLRTRLDELGVRPKRVFHTHLHFDHSAGALDMPAGTIHVVGVGEPEFHIPLFASTHFFRNAEAIEELDFSRATEMPIFGRAIDLLGDGSLWAVPSPGHSPGHVSYIFNGRGGPALIAGDAVPLRSALEPGVRPGTYAVDRKTAYTSAERIRAFIAAYPKVQLLTGHEQ